MGRNPALLMLSTALLLALLAPCTGDSAAVPWPSFRHDMMHSGRSGFAGPTAGGIAWSTALGGTSSSSPAVAGGRVYAVGGGFLTAVELDGSIAWSVSCNSVGPSSPAVGSDGTIHVASTDGYLYAFYPDGSLRWRRSLGGLSESSPAIGPDGTIYVGCAASKLVACRPDGTVKFSYTAGGAIVSSPAVASDGTIYFGCDDGQLYALTSAGVLKWKFTTNPLGAIKSSPCIGTDGTVYFGTMNSYFYAIWPAGTQRWRYAASGAVYSSAAIGENGTLVFGCRDKAIYCLSQSASLRWKISTGQYVDSSPAIDANGVTYVGSSDGRVYAISPTGSVLWSSPTGGAVISSPAIGSDAALYVTTQDGRLVAIRGDLTPPALPIVTDDGQYSTSANSLHASWISDDPESGIAGYDYAIGTSPTAQDVIGFTSAGTATEVTRTDLTLVNGLTYYFFARAMNGAGMVGPVGVSDGITVDLTLPLVTDVIINISAQQARVRVTGTDPESGVTAAECALLESPGQTPANWVLGASGEEFVLGGPLDPAKVYYVAARVLNGAGLVSETTIKGPFRLDDTPPSKPVVTDDGQFSTNMDSLHASWTSSDPESGVDHYSCWVGTSESESSAIGWAVTTQTSLTFRGLDLANGATYYVGVRAVNRAGLASEPGYSDGIKIDTTPPSVAVVVDDGEFTSIPDCLHASIHATDAESGIAGYTYCIGTSPGANDLVGWTYTSSQQGITACGLQLQTGVRYYFTAKATNGAGLVGGQSSSDGIEYRRGVSVWWKFRADSGNTGRAIGRIPTEGTLRWQVQTGGYVESSAAIGGDGTVYVGSSDGKLYSISTVGAVRWTYQTGSWIDSSPALGPDGAIYVGAFDGLYCIGTNGALRWKYTTPGMVWSSPNVGSDGTVYFGCQDKRLYAVRPDGTLKWSYSTGGEVWSSPAIAQDGSIYSACGDGKLYALTASGTLKWSYQTGSAADASPAIADDGTIYFGSGDAHLYAITPTGQPKWRVYLGTVVDSSAAIGLDGGVYVGTGGAGGPGGLYAISPQGNVLWQVPLPQGVRSSPAIDSSGTICVGCANGKIYAYNRDGVLMWSYSAGGAMLASPAIGGDGALVIGSDSGRVFCFRDQAVLDTSPPTRPEVHTTKTFITPQEPITAWWSSSDPESGIESYQYAIGTGADKDDVVSWTNVGGDTSMGRSDLPLAPGRTYYVLVKATNYSSLTSEIGVSAGITVLADPSSTVVGGAKSRLPGTQVSLPGKIVTAVFEDCFFVEEPNRTSGIRCTPAASGIQQGAVVEIQGTVALRYGETVLDSVVVTPAGFSGSVRPVTFPSVILARLGIDSSGLLVRLVGVVTRVGSEFCVISDGSGLWSPRGVEGIEVRLTTQAPPSVGARVSILGVACKEVSNSQIANVIRAVPGSDFVTY